MKVSSSTNTPVANPVRSAISEWAALKTLVTLPGMHAMQALVGCQKRSRKSLTRSFQLLIAVQTRYNPPLVAAGISILQSAHAPAIRFTTSRYHAPMRRTCGSRWRSFAMQIVIALAGGVLSHAAGAWSNHALGTWPALAAMPELRGIAPVKVERLESFLGAEATGIGELLRAEEQWARQNVPRYPPLPDALAFRADAAAADELRRRFVAAVRINPDSRLALFIQLPPGQGANGRATLRESDVTVLKRTESTSSTPSSPWTSRTWCRWST